MTLNDAVAKRLLELCEERDYSLNQFATISGISHSTLQSIIDGQSQAPKITTIKKICDGFDMKLKDYFDTDYFDSLEQEIQ